MTHDYDAWTPTWWQKLLFRKDGEYWFWTRRAERFYDALAKVTPRG